MDCQSLRNRVLAFVLRKVKYTEAREAREAAKIIGGGVAGAKEEKSGTSQRKSQPLPGIPKAPKEKEQKTRLPPMRTVHGTPKRAGHLAVGKGWSGGCLLGLLGAKTLRGRRPAQSSPARLHQLTFTLSRLPTARCSRYLAPPPAFVPPAPRQPECGWPAGQLRALAGRRPCAGGEGGSPRQCPRSGGARGARGGAAGRLPRQRAGAPRWGSEGHRRLPHLSSRKKGTPSEGRAPERRSLHTPASDSWQPSHPATKKFRDAESDLKKSFPWPLTPSPPAPG